MNQFYHVLMTRPLKIISNALERLFSSSGTVLFLLDLLKSKFTKDLFHDLYI